MSQTTTPRCPHCRSILDNTCDSTLAQDVCRACGGNLHRQSAPAAIDDSTCGRVESFRHFELLEVLGAGAFGVVWRAHDSRLDRDVAVKLARGTGAESDKRQVELMGREARAAAQLQHAGIVPVYETGVCDGRAYVVTGVVDGPNLKTYADAKPLPARRAATICLHLAEALAHAHAAGVVHRDLKPSNILMDRQGLPHITDFGLAKREHGDITVTLHGETLGTPAYMSPEQAMGESRYVDRRTDLYSLGVILFELLTGVRPFRGEAANLLLQILTVEPPSLRLLIPSIPVDLETICLKCLEKSPQRRYLTANDLADDLRRYLNREPIKARPIGTWERSMKWCRRNPAWATVAAATAVAVLAALAAGFLHQRQLSRANQLLENAVVDAQIERQAADQQRRIAEARRIEAEKTARILADRELVARKLLYVDDIRQSQEFWKDGNLAEMQERLARHVPTAGLSDIRGIEWNYLQRQCRQDAELSIAAHQGPIYDIRFSPVERWIASAGEDRALRIHDFSGRAIKELQLNLGTLESIEFSPDGRWLAVGGNDGVVEVYRVSDWKLETRLEAHAEGVNGLAFSPNANAIVTGSEDHTVALWEFPAGRLIRRAAPRSSPVESLAMSPDGKFMAVSFSDGFLQVSSVDDAEPAWSYHHEQPVRCVRYNRRGTELATACHDGKVRIFAHDSAVPRLVIGGFYEPLQAVTFADDDRFIAASAKDGLLRLWDTDSGILRQVMRCPGGRIFSLASASTDRLLAAADKSGSVRLLNLCSLARDKIFESAFQVTDVKVDAASRSLYSSMGSHIARLETGSIGTFKPASSDTEDAVTRLEKRWFRAQQTKSIGLSADGQVLACGEGPNHIALLNAQTGKTTQLFEIPGNGNWFFAHSLSFSRDGTQLLTAGSPGDLEIRALDGSANSAMHVNPGTSEIRQAVYSPDGSQALMGGNRIVAAYSFAERKLTMIDTPPFPVTCVAFAPDGRIAVSGSQGGTLTFWDASTWKRIRTVKTNTDIVWAVSFSPDGKTLAVGTDSYALDFWHVDTLQLLFSLPFRHAIIDALSFAPNGEFLAVGTCSRDKNERFQGTIELLTTSPASARGDSQLVTKVPAGVQPNDQPR